MQEKNRSLEDKFSQFEESTKSTENEYNESVLKIKNLEESLAKL